MDDYVSKPLRNRALGDTLRRWILEPGNPPTGLPKTGPVNDSVDPPLRDEAAMTELDLDREDLTELLAMFFDQADSQIAELSYAISLGETMIVAKTAHKLKGGSGAIGAARVTHLASELETTAAANDLRTAPPSSTSSGSLSRKRAAPSPPPNEASDETTGSTGERSRCPAKAATARVTVGRCFRCLPFRLVSATERRGSRSRDRQSRARACLFSWSLCVSGPAAVCSSMTRSASVQRARCRRLGRETRRQRQWRSSVITSRGRPAALTAAAAAAIALSGCGAGSGNHGAIAARGGSTPVAVPKVPVAIRSRRVRSADGPMNQWLPLKPGTQWVRDGQTDVGHRRVVHRVVSTVTDVSRLIDGVRSVAVLDQDIDAGQLVQQSLDYFADRQARQRVGSRWLHRGVRGRPVHALPRRLADGVGGARAGVQMPAHPRSPTPRTRSPSPRARTRTWPR